jgi:hypothetical protein
LENSYSYTYTYQLAVTGISDNNTVVAKFELSQNYPNPFNPTTTINYSVPTAGLVTLKVYNVLGNEVETLVSEQKSSGTYNVQFIGNRLASGVYFYKLQAGSFIETKKMILLK